MSNVVTYHARGSSWQRAGKTEGGSSGDGFVLGVTEPTKQNTGVLAGVSRSTYSGPTTITTSGTTFENMDFSNLMVVNAANVTFINCYFSGSYAGDNGGGQVMTTGSNCSNIRFERCTFKPSTPGDRYNAIFGHDFTAYRCQMEHVVDGVGIANQHQQAVNVRIEGSWIGNLSWYADDGPSSRPNSHTDGTHNDCIQVHSGTSIHVIGNTFYGYLYDVLGTGMVHNQTHQIFLSQHTAYYETGDIHVNNNFIYGGSLGLYFKSNRSGSLGGGFSPYAVECKNNVWMDDNQRDYGFTHRWYHIRTDNNITLNGSVYTGGTATLDENGNQYSATSPAVDPSRQGQPVKVRSDSAA